MSTYLLVLISSFIIPLIFSFHSKIRFYKNWSSFFKANLLVAIPFIIWDILFYRLGVWGFSEKHLLGVDLFFLPLEEILFFIIIPFCCVFTYEVFNKLSLKTTYLTRLMTLIFGVFIAALGFVFHDKIYTSITFISLGILLIVLFFRNNQFLKTFFTTYIIITMTFFIIVNGILTGGFTGGSTLIDNPPVWYNNAENLDFRLWTIPIEDFFYSMLLLLSNIWLFEIFKKDIKKTD